MYYFPHIFHSIIFYVLTSIMFILFYCNLRYKNKIHTIEFWNWIMCPHSTVTKFITFPEKRDIWQQWHMIECINKISGTKIFRNSSSHIRNNWCSPYVKVILYEFHSVFVDCKLRPVSKPFVPLLNLILCLLTEATL